MKDHEALAHLENDSVFFFKFLLCQMCIKIGTSPHRSVYANFVLQVYDVESDTWYEGGSIPSKRFRFVAAALGDSIYIFGGQGALMGSHNTAGSKYPVLDVVDQYKETMTIGVTRLKT